jgi:hypothetical protein
VEEGVCQGEGCVDRRTCGRLGELGDDADDGSGRLSHRRKPQNCRSSREPQERLHEQRFFGSNMLLKGSIRPEARSRSFDVGFL